MKRIIMTADDFGMSEEINSGVKRGIEVGVINGVSVMVNMPYFGDAVAFLLKHPEVSVGLHFNLTEGRAISQQRDIPHLVSHQGWFRDINQVVLGLLRGKIISEEVERELKSQFDELVKTGIPIRHINSHQHIHVYPLIFKLLANFICRQNSSQLRIRAIKSNQALTPPIMPLVIKQWWIMSLYRVNSVLLSQYKRLFNSDYIFDLNWDRRLNKERFVGYLSGIRQGITEIICHPAVLGGNGGQAFLKPRFEVLSLLEDKDILKIVKKYNRF
jgi:predicted glycoside hydrolase/deacetylase ChbG (UPF0249 family)